MEDAHHVAEEVTEDLEEAEDEADAEVLEEVLEEVEEEADEGEEEVAEERVQAVWNDKIEMRQGNGAMRGIFDENLPSRVPEVFHHFQHTVTTQLPENARRISHLPLYMMLTAENPRLPVVRALLQCCMILHSNWTNTLLAVEDVHYLRKMAWVWQ